MKQLLHLSAAAVLLLATCSAQAQIARADIEVPQTIAVFNEAAEKFRALDRRLQHGFQRRFGAAAINGVSTGKHNTHISFHKAGERHLALFTNSGTWLQTIRFYDADGLEASIKRAVEDAFPEYSVLRVAEINVGGDIAHIVDIETHKRFKKVRVVDGAVDVHQEFDKQ